MAGLTVGRTVLRLLALQAAWSYERMQGVGLGWGLEPGLRALFGREHPRYREALARAAGFFNANPFLAPAAAGAELRLEADGAPGAQIERLRTALGGPLGALGDRVYWSGLVPALGAAAVIGVALGAGLWAAAAVVVAHNAVRLRLAARLLRLGWEHGLGIGTALSATALPRAGTALVTAAGFGGLAAVPIAGVWLLAGAGPREVGVVAGLTAGLLVLRWTLGTRASVLTLTLLAAALAAFWQAVTR